MTEEEKKYNEMVLKHMRLDSIFNAIMAGAAVGTFLVVALRYMNGGSK